MANRYETRQGRKSNSPHTPPASVARSLHGWKQGRSDTAQLIQRALADPASLSQADAAHLQRTIGNQAVCQLLAASTQQQAMSNPPAPPRQRTAPTIQHQVSHHHLSQNAPYLQRKGVLSKIKSWFHRGKEKDIAPKQEQSLGEDELSMEGVTLPTKESERSRTFAPRDEELSIESISGIETRKEGSSVEMLEGPNADALKSFETHYNNATSTLEALKIDPTARLAEFGKMTAEVDVEDYSAQILGNKKVTKLLAQIDESLGWAKEAPEDAATLGGFVADMLMFASLIPSQTKSTRNKIGKAKVTRLTANVISLERLVQILIQIAQRASSKGDVGDAPSLRKIGFDEKDSVGQRMLKLSLSNMQETAREHLQETPLFQAMVDSPDILRIMLSSGGAIDQRFQNTCAAAAINQEVQANASSIAGLLAVGRGVAAYVEDKVNDEELKQQLSEQHKRRGLKTTTLGEHAARRVKQARLAFDDIEKRATKIVQSPPVNTQALQSLTQEWSRVMQKLSAVVNPEEGAAETPVLSKTRIRGHWNVSAVAAFFLGAPFDRRKRRFKGISQVTYREALGETLDISTSSQSRSTENLNDYLGEEKKTRRARLIDVWDKVFEAGGTELSIPGHELYMQAMLKNKQKVFIIGDPLIQQHEIYTIAEMERYAAKARKGELGIRPDVLSGVTPPALLMGEEIPLFTNPMKLGDLQHKDTVMLTQEAKIGEIKRDVKKEKEWINVVVTPIDQPEKRGWIDPMYVIMLS